MTNTPFRLVVTRAVFYTEYFYFSIWVNSKHRGDYSGSLFYCDVGEHKTRESAESAGGAYLDNLVSREREMGNDKMYMTAAQLEELADAGANRILYGVSDTRGYEGQVTSVYFLREDENGDLREVAHINMVSMDGKDTADIVYYSRPWGRCIAEKYQRGRDELLELAMRDQLSGGILYRPV